jgi:DNA-binding CsgD family transcriptional regulator
MRLNHSDYRRLNDAIAVMYRRAFTIGPAAAITETLVRTIGGVNAVAGSLRGTQVTAFSATSPVFAKLLMENTRQIARNHPRFRHVELAGTVLLTSDFVTKREWESEELFGPGWKSLPYADDLGANMVLSNGGVMSVAVMRDRRTFRKEEREILSLFLPHIETLLSPAPTPDASSLSGLGLTRREQEVLFWVSEGKRNSEIAEILGISVGTVKRHLENLYEKLGVENRHGAARRALEKLRPLR